MLASVTFGHHFNSVDSLTADAAVLELHDAAAEERCLVLAEAQGVPDAPADATTSA